MNYWLDLFTAKTWEEFLSAGAEVSGFREGRWKTVQKIRPGDRLLCYVTGASRFAGVLEVTSEPFKDSSVIWSDDAFPCRVKVKAIITLPVENAVPVVTLKSVLSVFLDLKSPAAWTGHFRGSPARWSSEDGEHVLQALEQAKQNPVIRPVDPRKLNYRPRLVRTSTGTVVVPESEGNMPIESSGVANQESTAHERMQLALLKMGVSLGLDVWVARNDRSKSVDGTKFTDIKKLINSLPVHFDDATTRTIELIDVLWLKGKTIVTAFEIESTTSIYSGLLRMSDLISMQPNLNIPLYIVAPDDRREKVRAEIMRPTFSRLNPSMSQVCGFIPFSILEQRFKEASAFSSYLKPEFIEEFAEFFGEGEDSDDVAA